GYHGADGAAARRAGGADPSGEWEAARGARRLRPVGGGGAAAARGGMILVDTSVWVDHLHRAEPRLGALMERDLVWCHKMVIAELARESLALRKPMLAHTEQ